MKTTRLLAGMIAAGFLSAAMAAPQDERLTTRADQRDVAVTIYNENLALVKDGRKVRLDRGANQLAWREVSAQMRPETALLRNVSNPAGLKLVEQNFDFDLLTPQKLLEKYVGREVTVISINPASGAEKREAATVLATNGGVVLKFADRIETGVPGRLAFSGVPDNLRDKPTLVISLTSASAGEKDLELSYLTGGLSWKADYVAELNEKDDRLDINGWVTLSNRSGTAYPNAKLQLVAGDVNLVQEELARGRPVPLMAKAAMAEAADMSQEALFEYHLYTLERPTTIADNQTKQVALMSAAAVPVKKELLLEGQNYYYSGQYGELGQKLKAGVFVEFANKGAGLGNPASPRAWCGYTRRTARAMRNSSAKTASTTRPGTKSVRLKTGRGLSM